VATIEKQFGKGSIMRLGDEIPAPEVRVVPTGSLGLDIALGVGGLPRAGWSRSTVPSHPARPRWRCTWGAGAEAGRHLRARRRRTCAGTFPMRAAWACRTDDCCVAAGLRRAGPRYYRDAGPLWAVDVGGGGFGRGADPTRRAGRRDGDSHMGLQARLMSQALRKLTGTISKSHTLGGFHKPDSHEDRRDVWQPRNTTGGNALSSTPAYASTSGASGAEGRRKRWWVTGRGSRSSRTRWRRRFA